jgi:NDP-sugar pyrophosphorylase family protein
MKKVAILAGGLGERLGKLTLSTPKSMIKINDKPFIEWQLNLLSKKGVREVVLCTSHHSQMIKDFVKDGEKFKIDVKYSDDGENQLGTGGAIRNAIEILGESFMVIYGDSYLDVNYAEIEKVFEQSDSPAMMTVYKNLGHYDSSNVFYETSKVKEYSKKTKSSKFQYIDFGISMFKKEVFNNVKNGTYLDLADLCEELAESGKLAGFEVKNRFYEVGSIAGIEDFSEYLEQEANVI